MTVLHLPEIITSDDLPAVALRAAADVPNLREWVARNPNIPDDLRIRMYGLDQATDARTAATLVGRPVGSAVLDHVLDTMDESRPDVLAPMLSHNLPAARQRARLLERFVDDEQVAAAVLSNRDWPAAERLPWALAAGDESLFTMLATAELGPDGNGRVADLLAARNDRWLDGNQEDVPLAAARWPALLEHPSPGRGLLGAIGLFSADERRLFNVVGFAERLHRYGERVAAERLLEAIANNPLAPLAVQRRAYRLARRIDAYYLRDWQPRHPVEGQPGALPTHSIDTVLDRIEPDASPATHTTRWVGVWLLHEPALDEARRERLARILSYRNSGWSHAWPTTAWVAAQIGTTPGDMAGPELAAIKVFDHARAQRLSGHVPVLIGACGQDVDRWAVAWVLLTDGWDRDLADLTPVLDKLVPYQDVA